MSVTLITGAGSGIGAAIARRLAADGWDVVITGRRQDALANVAAGVPNIAPYPADMSEREQVRAAIQFTVEHFGALDAVIANAGIMTSGSAQETEVSQWDAVLATNLTAAFLLAQEAIPHVRAARGSFVAIGSIAALRAPAGASAYAVSKAGLSMLVRTIAIDEGPAGVRSNIVHPGWVRTEMGDAEMHDFGAHSGMTVDQAYEHVTALVPARRPGLSSEVAGTVAWLVGPDASYVNGAEIVVDGGTIQVDPGTVPLDVQIARR